jgi:hypothetical protein
LVRVAPGLPKVAGQSPSHCAIAVPVPARVTNIPAEANSATRPARRLLITNSLNMLLTPVLLT